MPLAPKEWTVLNPGGRRRVIVTKELPGTRWLDILTDADCAVEVWHSSDVLSPEEIAERIGDSCDGAIGQLTEDWNADLFARHAAAAGTAYSNYAVCYNSVDVAGATAVGIPVVNTPGIPTETTAEMAVALTFSVGRRVVAGDRFTRQCRHRPPHRIGDGVDARGDGHTRRCKRRCNPAGTPGVGK